MKVAALYTRISLDRRDGEGVARQLTDCRAVADERGWDSVEYSDNDMSAFHAKRRPAFDRMLADLSTGKIQAVVAYHPDRLYRRLTDLEQFIEVVERAGAVVVTVKAGDLDLSTASGRMVARILGSVARHESERSGERVARAKLERAREGRPAGGGHRPYGLNAAWTEIVPEEAAVIREVAEAVRSGQSNWTWEAKRLNAADMFRVSGVPWTVGTLRRTVLSPHVVGLRTYHGEVIGEASWPAILDRTTWDELRVAATARRRGRPPSDRHLLTGLMVCGKCGGRLYANETASRKVREYRCIPMQGCGGISIAAGRIENHVESTILRWLSHPAMMKAINEAAAVEIGDRTSERIEIERRQRVLAAMWAGEEMTDDEYRAAKQVLERRLAALEDAPRPRSSARFDTSRLAKLWPSMPPASKRDVISVIMQTPIVVAPHVKGQPVEERVVLAPTYEVRGQ